MSTTSTSNSAWALVTGFGPFDASPDRNPSWEAVNRLPEFVVIRTKEGPNNEIHVYRLQLPVDYRFVMAFYRKLRRRLNVSDPEGEDDDPCDLAEKDSMANKLIQELPTTPPMIIMHVGVAPGSKEVQLEQFAYNETKGLDVARYVPANGVISKRKPKGSTCETSLGMFNIECSKTNSSTVLMMMHVTAHDRPSSTSIGS
jgi:pyrrolidone-carboxylate peptidase